MPLDPRFLSIITVPSLLLLAYFLIQKQELIAKILKPAIIVLLLLTSIGFVYKSELRHYIDDEKKAFEYLSNKPNNVYVDEFTYKTFNYLSQYDLKRNVIKYQQYAFYDSSQNYALDLAGVSSSYVIVNRQGILYRIANLREIKYPKQVINIPPGWTSVKTFGKLEIYST